MIADRKGWRASAIRAAPQRPRVGPAVGRARSGLIAHCPATADSPSRAAVTMLLAMNPPLSLAGGWVLMLVAMMSPLLIEPVSRVRLSSFRHRRMYAMALFLAGYVAIWMVAGALLFGVAIVAGLYAAPSWTPVAMAFLVAAVWRRRLPSSAASTAAIPSVRSWRSARRRTSIRFASGSNTVRGVWVHVGR